MELGVPPQALTAAIAQYDGQTINFEPARIAEVIMTAVGTSLQGPRLMLADLHVHCLHNAAAPFTLDHLLQARTALLDAVIWLCLPPATRGVPVPREAAFVVEPVNYNQLARSLAAQAMFILLRGKHSDAAGTAIGPDIPNIIHLLLGDLGSPNAMCTRVASFGLEKIGTSWVRHIDLPALAAPWQSRLALGLAGYRYLSVFRYYRPERAVSNLELRAWFWVAQLARAPLDWDLVVATRNPALMQRLFSLNKGCMSLIARCLNAATIANLVQSRILFAAPVDQPRDHYWRTWPDLDSINLVSPVFLPAGQNPETAIYAVNAALQFVRAGEVHGQANLAANEPVPEGGDLPPQNPQPAPQNQGQQGGAQGGIGGGQGGIGAGGVGGGLFGGAQQPPALGNQQDRANVN